MNPTVLRSDMAIPLMNDTPSMLVDTFGRRFSYLRLSVTDACNFRCTYCLPEGYCPGPEQYEMGLGEIRCLLASLAKCGTEKVRLTGGEPTLRKDLVDIVAACKQTPGIKNVALTSNAYRLTKQLPALVAAGLDALNVSADSLDPEAFKRITGHAKLEQVICAIDMALDLGIPKVKLNVVLMKEHNARTIQDFIAFVKHRPVSVRFIELMRTNDNPEFYAQQYVPGQTIMDKLLSEGWTVQERHALSGPAVELTHKDFAGSIGLIMPYSRNFCADCNRLRVAANGKLHLCLFNEADADLKSFLQANDQEGLIRFLEQTVKRKWQGHQLDAGYSGSTRNLAMLGG